MHVVTVRLDDVVDVLQPATNGVSAILTTADLTVPRSSPSISPLIRLVTCDIR